MKKFILCIVMLCPLGVQANDPINMNTSQNVLQRQEVMENEMREMRGRIESLEHELKIAQNGASSQSIKVPQAGALPHESHVFTQAGKTEAVDDKGTRLFTPPEEVVVTSSEDKYKRARNLITIRKYEEARVLLQELVHENPGTKYAIDSNYWLGEIAFINGEHEAAAMSFGDSYSIYEKIKHTERSAKSSKAANSLIQLARCLNKMGKRVQAVATLKQLDTEFPDHPRKIIAIMAKRARKEIEDRRPRAAHL